MDTILIWDWNGTLLDDVDAVVTALNRMLAKRRLPPVTRDFYRTHFGFPARDFYCEIGMDPALWDWDEICEDFHRFVREAPQAVRPEARAALAAARAAGFRQVVLSALREDLLRRDLTAEGLVPFFEEIHGSDNLDGAGKGAAAQRLVTALNAAGKIRCVFIGDTLHDAEVARTTGCAAVLVGTGHQTSERLVRAGFPVVDTLTEAVQAVVAGMTLP